LHLGHALSALTGFEMARASGGRFLLRIEDIDTTRSQPPFIDAIFRDLQWLGLTWEEPVLRQSEHFDVYAAATLRLQEMGLLYPCFATRLEIAAAVPPGHASDPDGAPLYPGLHRHLAADAIAGRRVRGETAALRLNMQRAMVTARRLAATWPLTFHVLDADGRCTRMMADPERWGDAVIVRKDTPASYHLACVVDDARQGITHVTRGHDLQEAVHLHVLLQVLLGVATPVYHHHRLNVDGEGRKLSKSAGAASLATLRADGASSADVRRMIGL
jgi:glutamyl-Q tRNA(Asp) synthetase